MPHLRKRQREKIVAYGKGTISLFLIILLTPFMFVAVMLVEGQKVASSTSIIDEAMGVTSTSVLANYDDYLLDRWGLTAISQDLDINSEYSSTLKKNLGVLGNTLDLQKTTAKGRDGLNLDDLEILKRQVLEYSKYNVPIKLGNEALNITQLLSSLESIGNLKQIGDLISGTSKAVESVADLCREAKGLGKKAKKVEDAKKGFKTAFDAFEEALNDYSSKCDEVDQLRAEEDRLSQESAQSQAMIDEIVRQIDDLEREIESYDPIEDATAIEQANDQIKALEDTLKEMRKDLSNTEKSYRATASSLQRSESKLQALKETAEAKRDEYAEAIGALSDALVDYEQAFNKCAQDVVKVSKSVVSATGDYKKVNLAKKADEIQAQNQVIQDLKDEKKTHTEEYQRALERASQLSNELADQSMTNDIIDVAEDANKELEDSWKKVASKHNSETIDRAAAALATLQANVASCSIAANTNPYDYAGPEVGGVASKADIDEFLKAQRDELISENLQNLTDGLTDFLDALFDVDLFFDGTLSAYIDADMYESKYGGLLQGTEGDLIHEEGITVMTLMGDVSGIVKTVGKKEFIEYIPVANIPAKLVKLAKLLKQCGQLFDHLVQFGKSIAVRIYEKVVCSSYMVYNLPCRVDVADTASNRFTYTMMTGYDMNLAGLPSQGGGDLLDVGEDLSALVTWIQSAGKKSGDDITFSGAELEYVLFGSNSEVSNQLYVFVAFMLCRLVTTIPAVTSNAEAQLLAGATGLAYGLVMTLLVVGETFVDTLLLVNGGQLDYYEKSIHLSITGIPKLVDDIAFIGGKKASKALETKMNSGKRILEKMYQNNEENDNEKYRELKSRLDSDPYKAKTKVERARDSYVKSLGKFEYRDFCLMLLLITVPEHQQMARLRNLIQMEGLHYYSSVSPKRSSFDIRDTFVALDATADVKISWSLPSVTGSSWLSTSRHAVRGY